MLFFYNQMMSRGALCTLKSESCSVLHINLWWRSPQFHHASASIFPLWRLFNLINNFEFYECFISLALFQSSGHDISLFGTRHPSRTSQIITDKQQPTFYYYPGAPWNRSPSAFSLILIGSTCGAPFGTLKVVLSLIWKYQADHSALTSGTFITRFSNSGDPSISQIRALLPYQHLLAVGPYQNMRTPALSVLGRRFTY